MLVGSYCRQETNVGALSGGVSMKRGRKRRGKKSRVERRRERERKKKEGRRKKKKEIFTRN